MKGGPDMRSPGHHYGPSAAEDSPARAAAACGYNDLPAGIRICTAGVMFAGNCRQLDMRPVNNAAQTAERYGANLCDRKEAAS